MKSANDWNNLLSDDKPVFSETLCEQEKEVEEYEQTKFSRDMRAKFLHAPHHPIYHFTKPEGYLNDPNGLCYRNGKWHLFYQALGGVIHWAHAVSDDLVTWKDLPFAIYPKYENHCFSGSICIDHENNRAIAAYYGFTGYDENGRKCGTMIAVSSDPLLLNWTRVNDDKAVITDCDAPCWTAPDAAPVPNQKPYQVYDSCIWKEDGVYYILEAGYTPNPVTGHRFRQCYLLKCENDDLLHWEFVRTFLDNDIYKEPGDDCACPYFLKIGDKRLMLHFSHRVVPKYLIGDYDKETYEFTPFIAGRFTSGYGITIAPSAFTDENGSVVCIFNEPEAKVNDGWGGVMSLPRRFTLGGHWNDELYQAPYCDYSSLHENHVEARNITLPAGKRIDTEMSGNAFEMVVELEAGKIPDTLEIDVLRSSDGSETTKITFMKEQGGCYAILPYTRDSVIMIDTTHSSLDQSAKVQPPETASVVKQADEDLKLQIFVDKSIIEVFVNDKQYLVMRAYPSKEDSVGVSFTARGTDGEISNVDFWTMKPIW